MEQKKLPDFVELVKRYNNLTNGQRAELRRVAAPDELALLPSFYHLIANLGQANDRWCRLAFFLPYVQHKENGPSFGRVLKQGSISEKRLFQVVRSQAPNDLLTLRRLAQQVKPTVDWSRFGKSLFFWTDSDISKKQLINDYFVSFEDHKDEKATA
ncbi:MAG: type I-E CRISPR-associated protein Cse2/CasB [Proteobacteria bacterium]|nr:type I-E CRISPR-associated protein Cse2/CasB [Pseudomonadota bacterium]MBU1688289.1 type I-E CRISPR-associated protein Cse2/CasB [Pseudomonadota bacterium]